MTLEDKMARAIAIDAGESWEHLPENLGDHLPKISKDCYRSMARAARAVVMTEMRQPSDAMEGRAGEWHADSAGHSFKPAPWLIHSIWKRMLAQFEKDQAT